MVDFKEVVQERGQFKRVIIVTGTPGVGKTTVSKQLAAKLNGLHIDLGELVKREKLTSGYDRKRQTLIADMDGLANRLRQIINQEKRTLIIDGHYATAVVPKDQVEKVFVLRRDPRQLKQLLEKRGFTEAKVKENVAAEILDIVLYEATTSIPLEKVCEIDTTGKTVADTVNNVVSVYLRRQRCNVGIVNWMKELERENMLDEYLGSDSKR
jgi:adenylate kinase